MKTLEYVKEHFAEFEKDNFYDRRFTSRFVEFLPTAEWGKYGFEYNGNPEEYVPKEWTEENILAELRDAMFGYGKAEDERGITTELVAMVVNAWCKVLENGLNLDGNDGWYHIKQFKNVLIHYGWMNEVSE